MALLQQKVVITGGPGTGKSTIIDHLAAMEFECMPEISRSITRKAQQSGVDQLFLTEPLLFSELLLQGRVDQFTLADTKSSELVFFDRGIPDVFGYLNYLGMDFPEIFLKKSKMHRYTKVFMMPPWEDIYTTDNERYESFAQSLRIYEHLREAYFAMNYEIITVPQGSVKERVDFLLESLGH